ncbi:MAG: hypothetical protein JKY56_26105, partial [Kofleriaceae bacterium]|nr:hypothetical protein [Kofleriaceae bacterium]
EVDEASGQPRSCSGGGFRPRRAVTGSHSEVVKRVSIRQKFSKVVEDLETPAWWAKAQTEFEGREANS